MENQKPIEGMLIRGMAEPETCVQCKLMVYNPELVWDDAGKETVGAWVCLLTGELIDNTKREEHCPLVPFDDSSLEGDGEWVLVSGMMVPEMKGLYQCSLCGYSQDYHIPERLRELSPFCPGCGKRLKVKQYE